MRREELLKCARLDAERFKNLAKRDQLPFQESDRQSYHINYSAFEALLLIIATDFADLPFDRKLSAEIVGSAAQILMQRRWDDLILALRDRSRPAILLGALWTARDKRRPFVGTLTEMAQQPEFILGVVANASSAISTLQDRALEEGVQIDPSFWMTRTEAAEAQG
jgi:hypothetical protein